ncbi:hypothetical protein C0993_011429 [Termitomyces sp. T159_Od127]|nr:hypothetical protein C0993_011429 [Termitomyces sp. T159_Od127]
MFILTPIKGRIRSEKFYFGQDIRDMFPLAPKSFVDFSHALDDVDVPCLRGRPGRFFQFSGHLETRRLPLIVNRWLNDAVVTHNVGPKLVEKSGTINPDVDLRIRPFTVEEHDTVQNWLMLSQEIDALTLLAEVSAELSQGRKDLEIPGDSTVKILERKITWLKAEQEAITPQWWKEWRHVSQ